MEVMERYVCPLKSKRTILTVPIKNRMGNCRNVKMKIHGNYPDSLSFCDSLLAFLGNYAY